MLSDNSIIFVECISIRCLLLLLFKSKLSVIFHIKRQCQLTKYEVDYSFTFWITFVPRIWDQTRLSATRSMYQRILPGRYRSIEVSLRSTPMPWFVLVQTFIKQHWGVFHQLRQGWPLHTLHPQPYHWGSASWPTTAPHSLRQTVRNACREARRIAKCASNKVRSIMIETELMFVTDLAQATVSAPTWTWARRPRPKTACSSASPTHCASGSLTTTQIEPVRSRATASLWTRPAGRSAFEDWSLAR